MIRLERVYTLFVVKTLTASICSLYNELFVLARLSTFHQSSWQAGMRIDNKAIDICHNQNKSVLATKR
jgi:hypothetical protein